MPNTVPASAPALPSRRTAILASFASLGAVAGLPAPSIQAAPSLASFPITVGLDATFALIERHRAAYIAWNAALGPDCDDAEAEDAAEDAAFLALVEREPTTLAGLRAFAEYLDAHIKRGGGLEQAQWALATLAEACRLMIPSHADGGAV